MGLTVPKALGKAIDRNRIKRRLRAAVRTALPLLSAPVDVVLHPRRSVRDCEYEAITREVAVVFRAVQAAFDRVGAAPPPASAVSEPAKGIQPRPSRKPADAAAG